MTTIIGCDQSLSKSAFTVLKDGKIILKDLAKTGDINCKGKKFDSVEYFENNHQRIHHVCDYLISLVEEHYPCYVVWEGISYGSVGDATRNLAMLYGAMYERLLEYGFNETKILIYPPTKVKAYEREWLQEDKKYVTTGTKTTFGKMDKKLVEEAVRCKLGQQYLDGYKASGEHAGIDDIADSAVLAVMAYELITGEIVGNQES